MNVEIPPIPHMTYDDAMTNYGSDRPDLRFGMKLHDVTDLGQQTDFGVFKSAAMVKCIVIPSGGELTRKYLDGLVEWAKGFGAKGLAVTKVVNAEGSIHPAHLAREKIIGGEVPPVKFETGIAKFLAPIEQDLIGRLGVKSGDLVAFAADKPKIVYKVLGELRLKMAKDLKLAPTQQYEWVWITDFPLLDFE